MVPMIEASFAFLPVRDIASDRRTMKVGIVANAVTVQSLQLGERFTK
jgi:hypothetical protein